MAQPLAEFKNLKNGRFQLIVDGKVVIEDTLENLIKKYSESLEQK